MLNANVSEASVSEANVSEASVSEASVSVASVSVANLCETTATMDKKDLDDLFESICLLIDAYINVNIQQYIQPNFHALVVKSITDTLTNTLMDVDLDLSAYVEPEVERGLALFYKHISPPRSNGNTFVRRKPNVKTMRKKIQYLTEIPQPEQRTTAWYEFRYKHLTASNIWKCFISDSTRNQLIFEKCQPLSGEKYRGVSLDSPMHWGQKYEPLSVMLYEEIYKANVSDFGCIPHRTLNFLAASPDGIVTEEASLRYGRMLEVKNIVNREITGLPKMEYWVQMQLQMEVCELNECDFLETRFVEYADKEAYELDVKSEHKGRMMLFMTNDGKPVYEYAPLVCISDAWQEEMMEKNSTLNWIKNIYWKLDQLSCVLVLRNKLWFKSVIPQLKTMWDIIEKEKQSGYSHREPKKNFTKVKKLNSTGVEDDIPMNATCFITIL
jgi:putative phage-type endonuclease